jgi:hypothetical protein
MSKMCLSRLIENTMGELEIVVMDGGGDFKINPGDLPNKPANIKIIHDKEAFPAWKYWMEQTTGDIMVFMHNDIMIDDYGFDVLLRYIYEQDPKLGLLGFVGSDEMNAEGSRGWGTTSNFLGKTYSYNGKTWSGLHADTLGECFDGLTQSIMIDGCVMGMRRSAWNKLGYHKDQSMYHYYDRLMSCRFLEAGYTVATIGVGCDHISNQTAALEIKWHKNVEALGQKHNIPILKDSTGKVNWDISIHEETKRRFLEEWRDQKHFIPLVIND